MTKQVRRRIRARALEALVRAGGLAPVPLVHGMLAAVSPLARFSRYERRTLENLRLALGRDLGEPERRRIAVAVRRHAVRLFAEWLRLARGGDGSWIDAAVDLDPSIEILRREVEARRGVLIVTAHLGNWELLCARLRRLGLQGAVVGYERPRDPSSAWLAAMRRAYGVETLPQHADPRELLRILRRGGVVGLVADLEARRIDGEFLPFFGVPALTMTAPAALARAARLPLLPVRCTRERSGPDRGRYRLRVEEPMAIDPDLPRRDATVELAARLNQVFERWIRDTPDQWAWHQSRWRARPEPVDDRSPEEPARVPPVLIQS